MFELQECLKQCNHAYIDDMIHSASNQTVCFRLVKLISMKKRKICSLPES